MFCRDRKNILVRANREKPANPVDNDNLEGIDEIEEIDLEHGKCRRLQMH